ncbi:hypothetical protein HRS9139_04760 [Pyrenophora teres f. teres]|nr:hypothetical protein HRS9139_04760 [Pyrenophora teres f. teres]
MSTSMQHPPMEHPPTEHLPMELPFTGIPHGRPTPGSFDSGAKEKSHLDFTQRIERKLAEHNASSNVFRRWLFETTSWLVSAFCMVAIALIYANIKGQPMSKGALLLNLNNVLGKVASAALILPTSEALGQLKWNWFHNSKAMWDFEIFDKASRGPMGALMLLYRTKGRSLAALGALLIVLMLAIDTFFQQVVDMSDRWTLQMTAAVAPKAHTYVPGYPTEFLDGYVNAGTDKDTYLAIQNFSYGNGTQPVIFGNGTRPDIPVSCSTSNCTWPLYETLGVCSQCTDISTELSFGCLMHTVDWTAKTRGTFDLQQPYPRATACGYFLNATSDFPILMSGYLWDQNNFTVGEALTMRALPLTEVTKKPLYGDGSLHFKNIRHKIQDVFIVSAHDGTAEAVYRNETPVAQECHISWCVKKMQSSYTWGGYVEHVISTTLNTTGGPFPWLAIDSQDEEGNFTDMFYLENVTITVATPEDGREVSEFGLFNDTASTVIQGFNDIFPSFTTMVNESAPSILRFKTWRSGAPWSQTPYFNPWLAPNNVTQHMERLATALTNVVRSASSRQNVDGLAFSKETFITVRWAWLTFPLLLLVLSLVFLIATIIKTSKDNEIGLFKNSAMPTLIYSLPKETQGQFPSSSTWNSTKETKKIRIRLQPKTGWRVSGQMYLQPTVPSSNT